MPKVTLTPLAEMLRLLFFSCYGTEFSVHNGLRFAPDDAGGQEALAQYIVCSHFSTAKMS